MVKYCTLLQRGNGSRHPDSNIKYKLCPLLFEILFSSFSQLLFQYSKISESIDFTNATAFISSPDKKNNSQTKHMYYKRAKGFLCFSFRDFDANRRLLSEKCVTNQTDNNNHLIIFRWFIAQQFYNRKKLFLLQIVISNVKTTDKIDKIIKYRFLTGKLDKLTSNYTPLCFFAPNLIIVTWISPRSFRYFVTYRTSEHQIARVFSHHIT